MRGLGGEGATAKKELFPYVVFIFCKQSVRRERNDYGGSDFACIEIVVLNNYGRTTAKRHAAECQPEVNPPNLSPRVIFHCLPRREGRPVGISCGPSLQSCPWNICPQFLQSKRVSSKVGRMKFGINANHPIVLVLFHHSRANIVLTNIRTANTMNSRHYASVWSPSSFKSRVR